MLSGMCLFDCVMDQAGGPVVGTPAPSVSSVASSGLKTNLGDLSVPPAEATVPLVPVASSSPSVEDEGFCLSVHEDAWTGDDGVGGPWDPTALPLAEYLTMNDDIPWPEELHLPSPGTSASYRGRLRSRYAHWKAIGANGMVLDWVLRGYPLPFQGERPSPWRCQRNHPGALQHIDWLRASCDQWCARTWTITFG